MGKSAKTQRLREKMRTAVRQSKQTTLDNLREASKKEPMEVAVEEQKKQIIITEIGTVTKEDELALKVEFKLSPSKASFSKITADLFFDEHKMITIPISIPQSSLARDAFEFSRVFDMIGIGAGLHSIRVEMYELWSSGEKLTQGSKKVEIEYIPLKRADRLIRVPIAKSVVGADLVVVSNSEKDIYRELEESMKRESASKQDEW